LLLIISSLLLSKAITIKPFASALEKTSTNVVSSVAEKDEFILNGKAALLPKEQQVALKKEL
jgi:hypothetical protein